MGTYQSPHRHDDGTQLKMKQVGFWQTFSLAVARMMKSIGRKKAALPIEGRSCNSSNEDLTDGTKIAGLLMQALDSTLEVRVSFGGGILEYKSHFLPERDHSPHGGGALSSEYLRSRLYVLIDHTSPMEGGERIRSGRTATFSFAQAGKLYTFTASLYDNLHGLSKKEALPGQVVGGALPNLAVFFPDHLFCKVVQRDSVRIENVESAGVELRVRNEEGSDFIAAVLDISMGGCSFIFPGDEELISSGTVLELRFRWGEEREIFRRGVLYKLKRKSGTIVGHVGFRTDDYEAVRETGELVGHIERIHLRRRHNWSANETENLSELYQSN
jgi:hypothetical protein